MFYYLCDRFKLQIYIFFLNHKLLSNDLFNFFEKGRKLEGALYVDRRVDCPRGRATVVFTPTA